MLILIVLLMQILHHQASPHYPYRIGNNITNNSGCYRRIQSCLRLRVPLASVLVLGVLEEREEKRVKDGDGDHIGAIAWMKENVPA